MWPQTKSRIEEYILISSNKKSRFEIDSYLLQTGYEPEEIEMVWEELFPTPIELSKKEKFKNFLVELINPDFLFPLTFSRLFLIALSYAGFNILWIIGWKLISWVQSSANLPLPWDLQLFILATLLLIALWFFRKNKGIGNFLNRFRTITFYKKLLVWIAVGAISISFITSLLYFPQRITHVFGVALPYSGGLSENIAYDSNNYRNYGACAGDDSCRGKSEPACKSKAEISVNSSKGQSVLPLKQVGWMPNIMGLPHPVFLDSSQTNNQKPEYLIVQENDSCYIPYTSRQYRG